MIPSDGSRRSLTVARLRYLGHLQYRAFVRGCLGCFLGLATVFTVLPLPPELLARLGLATVGVGWLALLALYLSVQGTVRVRLQEGWYVAEDARAGIVRHGRSLDEALGNLAKIVEPSGRDARQ